MIRVLERPSIILKEMIIDYLDFNEDSLADEYALDIGRYPYVQIGNLVIQTDNTTKIVLHNDQFLPKVEIFFEEPTMKLIDELFPLDDEIVSLFIQSSSENLMPVRMDFKITEFNVVRSDKRINYVIVGLLNVDYLYYQDTFADNNTSFGILRKLAKKSNLGFATNIDDTDDLMMWINANDSNMEFIQDIVKHSYKSDNSFMLSYIDFYYNLNYVDIETELDQDISEVRGILSGSNFSKKRKDRITNLILTNHPDVINSNLYISKYNVINNSTAVNLDIGYRKYITYYDKVGNVRYEFVLDSLSTSEENNAILKGRKGEFSQVFKNSINSAYLGVIDTDNVHPNYLYAKVQNEQNLDFLQKVRMKITLNSMNFNLYRFQKIQIELYKLEELNMDEVPNNENDTENKRSIDWDKNRLNQRLSGEWLIIAINYTFNKHGGFQQEVTLARRELGFNDEDFK
ncbi:MAG: hypothetical protein ACOC2W_03355 [bacterium]